MPAVDPTLFLPSAVSEDTRAFNADLFARMSALPDIWSFQPEQVREARRRGLGTFPLAPKSPRAQTLRIPGPGGEVALRILVPDGEVKGVYLHIHGGGWVLGQSDFQDPMLEQLGARCGLAAVSVEYRLAPEHPFPAGPDDCEAAALWLAREGRDRFGTDRFFIGGESAGAHLSVLSLLRLRDRHGLTPFRGANLIAGCYDLALTPSARVWGTRRLVLDTRDIALFAQAFLAGGEDVRDASISPLYADLAGLPPALFSVGTWEAMLDDSLFMAARWEAAGNAAALKAWPGGVHVFQTFDFPLAREAFEAEVAFLNGL